MHRLQMQEMGFRLYCAGLPNFPRNFTRDSIKSSFLLLEAGRLGDDDALALGRTMLREQLRFCAERQSRGKDPYTGAEPGKIHHEYPGVLIRGHSTEFNGCDTTALFLLGVARFVASTGDRRIVDELRGHIEHAIAYVLAHLWDDLFREDASFSGADRFALKVTYWKDSELIDRPGREPVYPVIYSLAHIVNFAALRSIAKVINDPVLYAIALRMRKAIRGLWDPQLDMFHIAKDQVGSVRGISSDTLHALAYLERSDIPTGWPVRIVKGSIALETPIGYRGLDPALAPNTMDVYHSASIWPFEQAFIHLGAMRFGLHRAARVASRIVKPLGTNDAEIFTITDDGAVQPSGCDPQLWTIAAKRYFFAQGITARP